MQPRHEIAERELPHGFVVAERYRVGELLGRGGTAAVYETLDLDTNKVVAMKVMNRVAGRKMTRDHHLLLEAQLSMRLASPHTVRLYDVGVLPDGRAFLVMERLFGHDVGRRLLERGPMSIADACDIVLQACHALAEAHRMGVVHRDIKPPNLFLSMRQDDTPHVKVLDFGLAIMVTHDVTGPAFTPTTKDWKVAGSPGYAAPEQIGSTRSIDERADVWALGVVLHELVLGRRPFEGATLIDTLIAAGSDPVPPMGPVPPEFESIVRRCLEKDRERRFPNVYELAEALAPLAPPAMADYPDLVRQAGGRTSAHLESTQQIILDDDSTVGSRPSRANSALDGPASVPISSHHPEGTQTLARADATASFIAQVTPGQAPPWAGLAATVALSVIALVLLASHAHSAPTQARRRRAAPAPSASGSMLLGPLPRGTGPGGEAPGGWQVERPEDWREVP